MVTAGQTISSRVSALDLLPTFLRAAGTAPPPSSLLDGHSLLPLLRLEGQEKGRGEREDWEDVALFWRFNASCRPQQRAVLLREFKWSRTGTGQGAKGKEQKGEEWKEELEHVCNVVLWCHPDSLFDLSVDRNESKDLAALPSFRVLAARLASLHANWEKQLPPVQVSASSEATRARECARRKKKP